LIDQLFILEQRITNLDGDDHEIGIEGADQTHTGKEKERE